MPYHIILDGVMVVAYFFIAAQLSKNILTLNSSIPYKMLAGGLAGAFSLLLWMFVPGVQEVDLSLYHLPFLIIVLFGGGISLIGAMTIFLGGLSINLGWAIITKPQVFFLWGACFFFLFFIRKFIII